MTDIIVKHEKLNDGELKYKHLLGLKFDLGKQDCYTMAQRMFKDNLNIELANYARPTDFWIHGLDLYVDNFKSEGFKLIEDSDANDYRPLDCFLIAVPDIRNRKKVVTNHCAIYLNNGYVIHHRFGTLSTVDKYRGALRNLTTHHIRHKAVPDMRTSGMASIDLMEHILPHKKEHLLGVMNEHRTTQETLS